MKLNWTTHDDGYMTASGRKKVYIISEGFGDQHGMIRMTVNRRVAYFTSLEEAKEFAEGMEG